MSITAANQLLTRIARLVARQKADSPDEISTVLPAALTTHNGLSVRQKSNSTDELSTVSAAIQNAALAIHNGLTDRLFLDITSNQQAKVINARIAARVIRYYAYHAPKKSEVAVYSYDKFAEIGIETWIKDTVHYVEVSDTSTLLQTMASTLNVLAADMAEMKAELIGTEGYRAARVSLPALREWMENLDKSEFQRLQLKGTETSEELFTLNEWANTAQNGLVLSRSNKHALANLVSATYKSMALEMPSKVVRYSEKGYALAPVQAYPRRHFVLISMCFGKIVCG